MCQKVKWTMLFETSWFYMCIFRDVKFMKQHTKNPSVATNFNVLIFSHIDKFTSQFININISRLIHEIMHAITCIKRYFSYRSTIKSLLPVMSQLNGIIFLLKYVRRPSWSYCFFCGLQMKRSFYSLKNT